MSDKLFKQVGNEFVEVGYEFTGFPSNGVWYVQDGTQNCIFPMKEPNGMPEPALVSYMIHQEELMSHLSKMWEEKPLSVRNISEIACEFFALKAGAIKVADEIIEG